MSLKTKIFGIGVNDSAYVTVVRFGKKSVWSCPYYNKWKGILAKTVGNSNTRRAATLHQDWVRFSGFKHWADQQMEAMGGGDIGDMSITNSLSPLDRSVWGPDTCDMVDPLAAQSLRITSGNNSHTNFNVFPKGVCLRNRGKRPFYINGDLLSGAESVQRTHATISSAYATLRKRRVLNLEHLKTLPSTPRALERLDLLIMNTRTPTMIAQRIATFPPGWDEGQFLHDLYFNTDQGTNSIVLRKVRDKLSQSPIVLYGVNTEGRRVIFTFIPWNTKDQRSIPLTGVIK